MNDATAAGMVMTRAVLALAFGLAGACHERESQGARAAAVLHNFERPAGGVLIEPSAIYRRSHAVVIGIDAYEHLDRLPGAARDAQAMSEALRAHGFEVTTLIDAEATLERLREVLGDRLRQQLGPEDRALVYFAGHGVSAGPRGEEVGYLMPVQSKSYLPFSTGISMTELSLWFDGYPSKHVMFVADACYSGLALRTRGVALSPALPGYIQAISERTVRFSLVAGSADEEAHEWNNRGVFTHFVLEGMNGQADVNYDGLVTSDELTGFVRPQVTALVRARWNASQMPQSARSGTGEFIFFTPRGGAEAATGQLEVASPAAVRRAAPSAPGEDQPVAQQAPTATTPAQPPAPSAPADVVLNVIGIWNGPDGLRLRVQREGKKTILVGSDAQSRFVLGMIEKRRGEAQFEGAGRVVRGGHSGRFLQLFVRLTARDAYTAYYQATRQTLDANGLPVDEPVTEEPLEVRFEPTAVAQGAKLPITGDWEGGEERRLQIVVEGEEAVLTATDRWGTFVARSRYWSDDEAVFEGKGDMLAGPRKGFTYRVAVRLTEQVPDVLVYEPILQYLDGNGASTGASLLGYAWTVKRVTPSAVKDASP